MEDGELNSLIEGLSNANQSGQLVLTQQIQQQNPQTHFVVSPYPTNTFISTSESPFPTPSPSPSIILRSPAPVKSPIAHLQNIKSPIPVKSPGFQNVKSPSQSFQNVKSPNGNFQNVKSPNLYQVKSPGVSNIKSPASGVVKSPANSRSPGVCNPQSPAQAHSPFQHQVVGSPNSNRSPAPPPPTPSPTAPSPARPNTPQPAVTQYPPIAPNTNQLVQLLQPSQLVGRAQMIPGGIQNQITKSKQPQQILPKPLPPSTSPQKQSVPRLNTTMSQQTPLLINQPQNPSPTLVLNQVLTSGAPVLVQPAGPGGTVHLMLRPPTPTLQSGPGPPQNKMIITNSTQAQPQATVFIQNRQQVMRIMTAQGPMQVQQIQTPSGPQLIAIPQNQTLSFPTNSVLVQSPATNTIQLQQNAGSLQLQQGTTNTLQLQQNTSTIIQAGSFAQNSLPISQNQISLPNQILQTNAATIGNINLNKREEKNTLTDNSNCLTGANEQKKIVIDNKINNKRNVITLSNNNNNLNSTKKNSKSKGKNEEDVLNKNVNKNFSKVDNLISNPVSVPTPMTTQTTQKNITSSLRQIRPGAFANRNKQNQNTENKDKSEDANSKSLNNLTRIIDSVASNTEHLISPPHKTENIPTTIPPSTIPSMKVDNLTATINSVAENIKSPTSDEIMSNLSLKDVFIPGNKTLTLDKRPNLTIVQKQNKIIQPENEEPNLTINRLILSPNSATGMDFSNISESYDGLELGTVMSSAGVQTNENQSFVVEQSNSSNTGMFQAQEDSKKGKKRSNNKKKGKKEENKVDLWDLMKSAGIGDDEFDEPTEMNTFSQDTATITEGLEISATETEILAQLQSASQLTGNIRVVMGEDGRPVIINGNNILIPDTTVHSSGTNTGSEPSDAEAILQNMILPENVFNFTPQALATAQTQLNQLIQDHGGLTTSSADQQLLSQIFGSTPSSINTTSSSTTSSTGAVANISINASSNTSSNNAVIQTTNINAMSNARQSLHTSHHDTMMLNVTQTEASQATVTQKQETKSEFIGGPPPGLPPLGPDSLVITNNNGVPTLVASPALMQYLQTHQGIIQFQHDPVTKTIQPSLIIPHPQHKIEPPLPPQPEIRNDKPTITANARIVVNQKDIVMNKPRMETKTSVGTTTEDQKNLGSVFNVLGTNPNVPNIVKLNMVKFVKDNPAILQMATETYNLINYKETNKNLSEKEIIDIDKKIQQNRMIMDQCMVMENNRALQTNAPGMPNVILKDNTGKDNIIYQVGSFSVVDKVGTTMADKTTTETQTLEDLQNLDMTLIKGFQATTPSINSPTPSSDFQAKFLESIGMANKNPPKATVSIGTGTTSSPVSAPVTTPTTPTKRGRKKKNEKIQNQSTQVDSSTGTDLPTVTFNIAQLTPEQNLKLNQALQSRGVTASRIENLDAIKQIIHEEVKKITAGAIGSQNIRFVNTPNFNVEDRDPSEQNVPSTNMILSNPNLNQLLEQPTNQGNIISLQGNELVAINNGSQQIFTSQSQLLQGGHFVTSNNQILAIGGNHNQLVSLGNPINSSNQIVTLGNPSNIMSVNGNNVAGPQSVIVGSNGNVVAIVHQTPAPGQNPGIVQRVQTIQLTTPKQQHLKTIQSQIQTLSSKTTRTASEQTTLQKLMQEQQKILSTGKLVSTIQGQPAPGMQIVSQPITSQPARIFQQQPQQQTQQIQQTVQEQSQPQQQIQQTFITATTSTASSQPNRNNFKTAVSCGTNTSDFNGNSQQNIPKLSVPPTVMISDGPVSSYGPLYVSPNTSGKNVTKCEKGTSPIQIQMGTQTVTNVEYRSGKMSTGTMTSPNTGKPQAVVAPAIVIQQTESQSPPWQMKQRNQASLSPMRNQVPTISRTAAIEQQMRLDQSGATMPDTHTPFLSKCDAVKRLMRYHVMDEKALSPQDLATADDIFETTAQHLLDKFKSMKEKYKYLLMLESMRETTAAEVILITKLVITQEEEELIQLREMKKRLQDEYDNPTISYSNIHELNAIKTELMLEQMGVKNELQPESSIEELAVKSEVKSEFGKGIDPDDIKSEKSDDENDILISSNDLNNSDIHSDPLKDNPFKLTEANRNLDLAKMKSETKECKNTRTFSSRDLSRSRSASPQDFIELDNISTKCKTKNNRTFSDGSSKSSLDNSKDEDSGTDINAQVQSAIDSILNLQKSETRSNSPDEGSSNRLKKKRKYGDKPVEDSKRLKLKEPCEKREKNLSESDDDECESSQDQMLDEAIRSILTS